MLNLTIDQDAPVQSFLTIWPTGEARPLTSAANGVWPLPGISLGGVQGAATMYGTTPLVVTPTGTTPEPIAFATPGPSDGSVVPTNPTTFTVSQACLYSVDFHLNLTAGAVGTVAVFVNGVQQPPATVITALLTGVANTVLVTAAAGNTIQLDFIPSTPGATLSLTSQTIVVEQVTAN